jgi:hypothetical protein
VPTAGIYIYKLTRLRGSDVARPRYPECNNPERVRDRRCPSYRINAVGSSVPGRFAACWPNACATGSSSGTAARCSGVASRRANASATGTGPGIAARCSWVASRRATRANAYATGTTSGTAARCSGVASRRATRAQTRCSSAASRRGCPDNVAALAREQRGGPPRHSPAAGTRSPSVHV